MKLSIGLIFLTLMSFAIAPKADSDCNILHEGTFTYGEGDDLVKVTIKGNKHVEYHNDGKYYIKADLNWVNECEYNMTMVKVTIPNFLYGKGEVMNVKIDKVEGNQIYYTSTVKGRSWDGVFTKIE